MKVKEGAVFRLSEMMKIHFMVALRGFVRFQVCRGMARRRTATSADLRLAFAMERFLSKTSCVTLGPLARAFRCR